MKKSPISTPIYKHYQTCKTLISGCDNVIEKLSPLFDSKPAAKVWAFDYLKKFKSKLLYLRHIEIKKLERFDSPDVKWAVLLRVSVQKQKKARNSGLIFPKNL